MTPSKQGLSSDLTPDPSSNPTANAASPNRALTLEDINADFSLVNTAAISPDSEQTVRFFSGESIPLEMHRVTTVKRLYLIDADERAKAIEGAGYNTFLLDNRDVFLDMLTDSGVNSMSIFQQAAMQAADDAYAGSATFYRLKNALDYVFGKEYFLPAHQGRACENIIAQSFVQPGTAVITNYHFTTTKAHILANGGSVIEVVPETSYDPSFEAPFKGDMDLDLLAAETERVGTENIAFVRIEAGTNLIGGQPVSLANMRAISKFCKERGLLLVFDASLLADNLYFIKTREEAEHGKTIHEIVKEIAGLMDIIYFSARKLGCARGGGIVTSDLALHEKMQPLVPLYEGFLTYGGMSVREMEAIAIGLLETCDFHVISQTPIFVEALVNLLEAKGVPCVKPAGGLGAHLDAMRFVDHIPQEEYPAGALCAAVYLASGIRNMERGTLSEERNPDGTEHLSNMELVRMAVPKRAFTLSQLHVIADRIGWLYEHRKLIGGLKFTDEPEQLRFFFGRLKPTSDWAEKLLAAFKKDMPSGV
ncbi:MAG: tryptophanase [Coriobacteriales bacterium]|jgi:tryptophanase|nr:tryptophanase [Coriobacteriales bacterium]